MSGLLATVGITISACAPASFPLPGIDALGDDGPALADTQDDESVDDCVGLGQVNDLTGDGEPAETPQPIEAAGVPDVTPDLPEEPPVPMVDLSASVAVAADIGGLPTPTCAFDMPVAASATFPTDWPPCFNKPWPPAYGSFSPSSVISLPKQRLLLIGADPITPLPHRLWIVDSNLAPVCQPKLPWQALAKAEGKPSSSQVDIQSRIEFVRVAKDRFFVHYEHATWYKPVIVEYDLDCKMLFLRKGPAEDACGDCPGYSEPGVAFASTQEGGALSVTAYDRVGQVAWKSTVPTGVKDSLLMLGSLVAVRLANGTYVKLNQKGEAVQVFPGAVLGADDASLGGWGVGSNFLASGLSGGLAVGPTHFDGCGLHQWSRNFRPCGNGVVLCETYGGYFPKSVHPYFAGPDDFGWRIANYLTPYPWIAADFALAISSISPHGRGTRRLDVAYGGKPPFSAYFFKDGSYLAWNYLGLVRANRLGSTTCKGCGPPAPDCNDNDPCTKDTCDPSLGDCVHEPIAGCAKPKGSCFTTDDCDDADPCTSDACDKPTGACNHVANPVKNCIKGTWNTDAELSAPVTVTAGQWYPSGGWVGPVKSVRPQLHEAPDGGVVVVDEWEVRRYLQNGKERYSRALPEPAGASALAPDGGVVLYVRQPEGKDSVGISRFLRLKPTGQIAEDVSVVSGLADWILPDAWMERKRWLLTNPGGGYQFVGRKTWAGDTWHARVVHLSEALSASVAVELALPGIVGGDVPQTRGIEAVWSGKNGELLVGWRKQGATSSEFGAAAFDVSGKLLWSKGLLDGKVAVDAGFDPWRPRGYVSATQDYAAVVAVGPTGLSESKVGPTAGEKEGGQPWYQGPKLAFDQNATRHTSFGQLPSGLGFVASFTALPGKAPGINAWSTSIPPTAAWSQYVTATKDKLYAWQEFCDNLPGECFGSTCGPGSCYGGKCCYTGLIKFFECHEPIVTLLARDNNAILDVHVLSTGWTALLVGPSPGSVAYSAVLMLDKDYRFQPSHDNYWLAYSLGNGGNLAMYGCASEGQTWEVCCTQ